MAEAAGIALSAVALLASVSTAIDGYLILEQSFTTQDDARWLSLRYGIEKQRLECWRQEVEKSTHEGNHRLDALPPIIAQLISATLTEIHITHKEIEKIVAKHLPPTYASVDSPASILRRLPEEVEKSHRKSGSKGRLTWVIRDKDKFTGKLEKLEKATDYLYQILGLDASRAASRALAAYTVAPIDPTTHAAELEFLQGRTSDGLSTSPNDQFISSCAQLKLSDMKEASCNLPMITSDSLDLDCPDELRSMAFYKQGHSAGQRVLVEWKVI